MLIKKSDLHVCLHIDHPLAKKESLTFQDLKGVPMVGFGEKYDLHRYYVQKCHENGFAPTFSIITADVNISRNLVLENRSVSFAFPDYRKGQPSLCFQSEGAAVKSGRNRCVGYLCHYPK